MNERDPIVEAGFEEFCEFGVRRASMASIARRAGVTRTTVYRRFASKDELIAAVIERETVELVAQLDVILDGPGSIDQRVTDVWLKSIQLLDENRLIKKLLRHDRETILPLVTVDSGPVLSLVSGLYAERLRREIERGNLPAGADVEVAGEVLARLGISMMLNSDGKLPTTNKRDAAEFVRRHVLAPLTA